MKNKKFKLEIPLIKTSFWVLYGYKTKPSFVSALKTLKLSKDVLNLTNEYEDNEYYACVYVDKYKQVKLVHIISKTKISHEIIHVVDYLSDFFGFRGEKEFRAYLFEYIVKTIKNNLK